MHHQAAFLDAIIPEPDDDAPRLIYADWLEERGDPRAEFIRAQCELVKLSLDDPLRVGLETRERQLLKEYEKEWVGVLTEISPHRKFRRGLLENVGLSVQEF